METKEQMNEVLNDLVKINNDRIAGYEKAIAEAKDTDTSFKGLFEEMIAQSNGYKEELAAEIAKNGGAIEDETTSSGNIYRAWMDVKSTFTDSDETTILDSCLFGEEAAQRAYDAAIADDNMLDLNVKNLLTHQQSKLKIAKDTIKKELDAHTALKEK